MKRKWGRFGLQSFFACISLVALVAMALGWRADRTRLRNTARALQMQGQLLCHADKAIYSKARLFIALNQPGVIGRAVAEFSDVRRLADDVRCLAVESVHLNGLISYYYWQEALKNVPGQQCTGYYFSFGDPQDFGEGEASGFYVLTVDDKIAFVLEDVSTW